MLNAATRLATGVVAWHIEQMLRGWIENSEVWQTRYFDPFKSSYRVNVVPTK
jgi:hypothetical protein